MKKNLITLITIILILMITLSPISTLAATSDITISLTSTTTNIKEGDEVTVSFTVTDSKKINGLEADLKETDIFKIESVNIEQEKDIFHNWATSNNKLEISGNIASETLKVNIKLKVLKTPTTKATFTIEKILVNEDNTNWTEEAINMGNKSIDFSPVVEKKPEEQREQPSEEPENKPEEKPSKEPENKPEEKNNNNQKQTDGQNKQRATDPAIVAGGDDSSKNSGGGTTNNNPTTQKSETSNEKTATSNIPQTGENDLLIIGIMGTSIVAVATYIGYRKYKCI